ncbi:MAG: hypothetical protein JNK64_37000 [Myxococcales bacterium]|nr:hypothetical protein [Myxococcales bacterium]
MTAQEKNNLVEIARQLMTTAMALVAAEVFSGLSQGAALLGVASAMLRQAGDDPDADAAAVRAAECAGILAIPWPFIYIGSNAWIAAVRQLRDGLPQFVDLEPVARGRAATDAAVARRASAAARWEALPEAQRRALTDLGLGAERLAGLG